MEKIWGCIRKNKVGRFGKRHCEQPRTIYNRTMFSNHQSNYNTLQVRKLACQSTTQAQPLISTEQQDMINVSLNLDSISADSQISSSSSDVSSSLTVFDNQEIITHMAILADVQNNKCADRIPIPRGLPKFNQPKRN